MAILHTRWIRFVLVICALVGLYAVTRLSNLTLLPIFTDEAIYIRWSQIGAQDANWRFISLVDGKQPMFTWIMMALLRVIHDPLLAGRLVSVGAGFFTAIGMGFVSYALFQSKKISLMASFLYIIIPFGLMYDRLALYDSLSATFAIWSFYVSILLVKYVRLDVALILGIALGAGMLNKTSGFLSLYMLPGTLLLFDFQGKHVGKRLLRWFGYVLIAAILSQVIYSVLRLSPLFYMISQKNAVFVYPLREWLMHPFEFLYGNLRGMFDWAINYLTWPIFFSAIAMGLSLWKKPKEKLLLLGWWGAPFFMLALVSRVLYPRYILFMTLPLMMLAASGIVWIFDFFKKSVWRWVFIIFVLFGSIYTDYYIITNPLYAPIPYSDAGQYIHNWPSGWGVAEVNAYILEQSKKGKVTLYTDGTFGLFPYAVEIYLVDKQNITIHGMWPIPEEVTPEILAEARDHPTYVVFNQTQDVPDWPMTLIFEVQKGLRKDRILRLYKIDPSLVKPKNILKIK